MNPRDLEAFTCLTDWAGVSPALRSYTVKSGPGGAYVRLTHANWEPAVRGTGATLGIAVDEALSEWARTRDPLSARRPAPMGFISQSEFDES